MNDKRTFGEGIALLRKKNGLTQKELAEKLSVTDKAISRWETGKSYPDIETLVLLAETLDVSVNELLSGDIKITSKRLSLKKIILIGLAVALLLYGFPLYLKHTMTKDDYFYEEETSYSVVDELLTQTVKITDVIDDGQWALCSVGLTEKEAEEEFGLLSKYSITKDKYKDAVRAETSLNLRSVKLDVTDKEHQGYLWVMYDQKAYDEAGKVITVSKNMKALWCLDKNENGWYVSEVREGV